MTLKNDSQKWTDCKRSILLLAFAALIFFSSCKDEGPSVTIVYPANDEVILQGTSVTINVKATDDDGALFSKAGISSVQFIIDDDVVFTDGSSPYSYLWETSSESLGNHTISTIAIDEGDNQEKETVQVTINDAPTCVITHPGSLAYYESTVQFEVTASDEVGGVTNVEFYLDNSLLANDNSSPYSYAWNIGTTTIGYHTLKAIAIDYYGEETAAESTVEIKQIHIIGTWEGEYTGYDNNLSSNVEFRRHLVVNNDKTYENTLYGLPSGYSSDIIFEQESGAWEVNDAGSEVSWNPTTCQRIDISDPGTLIDWARGLHLEPINLNAAFDEWAVRDETLSVDYYIKKQ